MPGKHSGPRLHRLRPNQDVKYSYFEFGLTFFPGVVHCCWSFAFMTEAVVASNGFIFSLKEPFPPSNGSSLLFAPIDVDNEGTCKNVIIQCVAKLVFFKGRK